MEIKVFGQLTDITGATHLTVPFVTNTEELLSLLTAQYPALSSMTFRIAVNGKLTEGRTPLFPGDVIALLPPFSGV